MIPYSYNMVDMGGIDLAEANGTVVPGVYGKIVEAMNLCGDLILYNWKFAGINIAPSAYTVLQQVNSILINGLIQVTEADEVTVLGIEPPPPPIVPVEPLIVTHNDIYEATPPASGFNPVEVRVEGLPKWKTQAEWNAMSLEQKINSGLTLIGNENTVSGAYYNFENMLYGYELSEDNVINLYHNGVLNFHGFYSMDSGDRAEAGGRGVTWTTAARRVICNSFPENSQYGFFIAFALSSDDLVGTNTAYYSILPVEGFNMYAGGNYTGGWGNNTDVTFTHNGVTRTLQSMFALDLYTMKPAVYPTTSVNFSAEWYDVLMSIYSFLTE